MYVSLPEVQSWFADDRIHIEFVDEELEDSAMEIVRSHLQERYAMTGWVSEATTPKLVRKVVALLHDAWYFNRTASQSMLMETGSSYGDRLESLAMLLLGGIAGGSISLGTENPILTTQGPSFYPTDEATDSGEAPKVFGMAQVY